MSRNKNALLIVSEGINNHPSHIVEAIRLLVSKEYENVFVFPYPEMIKNVTLSEKAIDGAVNKVFSKINIDAVVQVENNQFLNSLFDSPKILDIFKDKGIKLENYTELVKPILDNLEHQSSQGRDALLIYKARTDNPTKEVEFQAAMQVCEMHGAIGVAVLVYKELPISNQQEWVDQINVLEPGFICTNEENSFIHELLSETNIPGADVTVITTLDVNKNQVNQENIDIQRLH